MKCSQCLVFGGQVLQECHKESHFNSIHLDYKLLTQGSRLPLLYVASRTPDRLLETQRQPMKYSYLSSVYLTDFFPPLKEVKKGVPIRTQHTWLRTFLKGTPPAFQSKNVAGSLLIYFPPTSGQLSEHLAATFSFPPISVYHMEILMFGSQFPPQKGIFGTKLCSF